MTPLLEVLSDREERVALMWGDGVSVGQIADELDLTPRQVRRICADLRRKLDKPNMAAVAVHVVRLRVGVVA